KLAVVELGLQGFRRQDHRRTREWPTVMSVYHPGWADPRLEAGIERDTPGLHPEGLRRCRLVTLGLDPHGHGRNERVRVLDLVLPAGEVCPWPTALPVDVAKCSVPVRGSIVIA